MKASTKISSCCHNSSLFYIKFQTDKIYNAARERSVCKVQRDF